MVAHHEPFSALAPIEWDAIRDDPTSLLKTTFSSAQTLIDSIPLPAAVSQRRRCCGTWKTARNKCSPVHLFEV